MMKPFHAAALATACLFAGSGEVEAQSRNFSPSYGYRAPGQFGGAGNIRAWSMIPIYNNEIRNPGGRFDRGFYGFNPYTPNPNPYPRAQGSTRTQGQNLARPQQQSRYGSNSSSQFNSNSQLRNGRSQAQIQAEIIANRPDPTLELRREQVRLFAKWSSDRTFKYVNNIIVKKSDGSFEYSPDWHLIIPKAGFKLPDMESVRPIKVADGSYYYMVSNKAIKKQIKKEVEASPQKAPTQQTKEIDNCCCWGLAG